MKVRTMFVSSTGPEDVRFGLILCIKGSDMTAIPISSYIFLAENK